MFREAMLAGSAVSLGKLELGLQILISVWSGLEVAKIYTFTRLGGRVVCFQSLLFLIYCLNDENRSFVIAFYSCFQTAEEEEEDVEECGW